MGWLALVLLYVIGFLGLLSLTAITLLGAWSLLRVIRRVVR